MAGVPKVVEPIRRALVLAGGRAKRFGGDKLAAVERGRTLLEHAISAATPHVDRVTVVLGPDGAAPPLPRGVDVIRDVEAAQGPLAGLATGLHLTAEDELVLLVAGDMPEASGRVLALLLAALSEAPLSVLGEEPDDRPRPLPLACVAGPAMLVVDRLMSQGERRLRRIIDEMPAKVVPASAWVPLDPGRGTLRDVDTPGDLRDTDAAAE